MTKNNTKVVCITGGTSGIGKNLTLSFLNDGHKVIAIGKGKKHANELSNLIDKNESNLKIFVGDLRKISFCEKIRNYIKKNFKRLDILINGAGTISGGGIKDETYSDWENVISTNLTATFTITKLLVDLLNNGNNPNIINISSVCSLLPCTSLSYSVSKAGTDMFTKALAKELAADGIRVNSVNPGVVKSNLQTSAGLFNSTEGYEDWAKRMADFHPLGRIGKPNDITEAVKFLTSSNAGWITGSILSVDGGRAIA